MEAKGSGLSEAQLKQVAEVCKASSYRRQAAFRFANRVRELPVRTFQIVETSVNTATRLGQQSLLLLSILLVLFIIHQIFLWVDRDPEMAFDQGALLFEIAEIAWDTLGVFYNAQVDIINAGILPVWNAVSFYVVEPTTVLALEIFSLAFAHQHWQGLFSEADFPYNGLDCTASFKSAEWCGRAAAYASRLESAEKAEGYADASGTYAATSRRMLSNLSPLRRNATGIDGFHDLDDTYVFGIATARRLAELGVESNDNFVAPAFDTSAFTDAILDLEMLIITLGSSVTDVAFATGGEILTQVFSLLVDSFFFVLRSLMMILKMLVSKIYAAPTSPKHASNPLGSHFLKCARVAESGMLTTVIGLGVDFAIIVSFTQTQTRAHSPAPLSGCCTVLHRDCPPRPLCRHRPALVRHRLSDALGLERSAPVRRGALLPRAQHCHRHARLHAPARCAAPLHGHHGGDAQLAHGQALLWQTRAGHLFRQEPHP